MKRMIISTLVGTASFVLAAAGIWYFTEMEAGRMLIFSLIAYYAGWIGSYIATEPETIPQRTRWELQIYDLKERKR